MYCGSSTYNDISCLDGFFFYTSPSLLSSVFLPNPFEDVKKEVQGNTNSNSRNLQASTMINKCKKLKMVSPNRNREDRANKWDLNILAQTQGLQGMVPTMVDTQEHVTEQALFPENRNHITSDNHQISTTLPPMDEEKLITMQAQVLQRRMHPIWYHLIAWC